MIKFGLILPRNNYTFKNFKKFLNYMLLSYCHQNYIKKIIFFIFRRQSKNI